MNTKKSFSTYVINLDSANLTVEEYLKNITSTDSEPVIVGNDGYIILKDVKIRSTSSNTITHMPFMVVFYDQIIGVSIGNIN